MPATGSSDPRLTTTPNNSIISLFFIEPEQDFPSEPIAVFTAKLERKDRHGFFSGAAVRFVNLP